MNKNDPQKIKTIIIYFFSFFIQYINVDPFFSWQNENYEYISQLYCIGRMGSNLTFLNAMFASPC